MWGSYNSMSGGEGEGGRVWGSYNSMSGGEGEGGRGWGSHMNEKAITP